MNQELANTILQRYEDTVTGVARVVADTFPNLTEVEDVEQEARILLLSYAGLVPSQHGLGHVGTLEDIEQSANGDEGRIRNILSSQLRLDLFRYYGREADKREPTYSLDTMTESQLPPTFELTDALSREANFSKHYPTLTLWLINGMTQEQIADFANVGHATVERRIAKEKKLFLQRYCRKGGLRVTGEESISELQEACGHLKAAGR